MLLRCFPPPVATLLFRGLAQFFIRSCRLQLRCSSLPMLAGRVVFHGTLSVPDCDDGAAMLLFQQFTEFFAAKLAMIPSLPCRDLAHDNSGYVRVTEGVSKLIFDLPAAKLVVVSLLPCCDMGHDNSGYDDEIEGAFQIDTNVDIATLQRRSPNLVFKNLLTQVERGCKPEDSVNAFQAA